MNTLQNTIAENVWDLREAPQVALVKFGNIRIDPQTIIEKVCDICNISKEEILSNTRKREVAYPRGAVIWMLRKKTKLSLARVGQLVGGKDHCSSLHWERTFDNVEKKFNKELFEMKELILKNY